MAAELIVRCGHGLLDLGAYQRYLARELENYTLSDDEIEKAQKVCEQYPKPGILKSR